MFHTDGSLSYAEIEGGRPPQYSNAKQYGALQVTEDVFIVSYLGTTGYALTIAMNFRDHRLQGFVSGAKEWYPVQGSFAELSK